MTREEIERQIIILKIKRNRPFGTSYINAIDSLITKLEAELLLNSQKTS